MIKLLIFDMDGTLIELKKIHYEALNEALCQVDEKYVISPEEHEDKYDGLPTMTKLNMLTIYKGLPIDEYGKIWKIKQDITSEIIDKYLLTDEKVFKTLENLKYVDKYNIVIASNSIRKTIASALNKTGLIHVIDDYISNEDVSNVKPNPEMFFKVMKMWNVAPNETMIFEDSKYGLEAAYATDAYVYEVKNTKDIIYEDIKFKIDYVNASQGFYR